MTQLAASSAALSPMASPKEIRDNDTRVQDLVLDSGFKSALVQPASTADIAPCLKMRYQVFLAVNIESLDWVL